MSSDFKPSEQLLEAVEEIAAATAKLPLSQRSLVDSGELHISSIALPNGATEFTVWSVVDYLVFIKERDGYRHIMKYVRGNWEAEAQEYWGTGFDFASNDQAPLATNVPRKEPLSRAVSSENTSGVGKASIVPNEIKGWNWGAFLLPLIWGIYHRVWLSLLLFIPIINLCVVIVFGADGNEWAWRNRKWDNIEHFKRTQRTWSLWGLGLLIVGIFIYALLLIVSNEP